jgi:hypothetical protein
MSRNLVQCERAIGFSVYVVNFTETCLGRSWAGASSPDISISGIRR